MIFAKVGLAIGFGIFASLVAGLALFARTMGRNHATRDMPKPPAVPPRPRVDHVFKGE